MTWQEALQNKKFKIQFIGILILLLVFLFLVPWYFKNIIEPRPGAQLNDFVLNLFPPSDHSTLIFILIYSAVVWALVSLIQKPFQFLIALTAYCIMNYLRMATLWIFPLEPPIGIIPLRDPIIEWIAYGDIPFLKDLFFSGHVATLSILALMEKNTIAKIVKWMVVIAVGLLLMHQRVHYSVDVVVGILVSVLIVYGLKRIWVSNQPIF
jgi:PAP2 superfamily C-terminal